jgi:protease YdgD
MRASVALGLLFAAWPAWAQDSGLDRLTRRDEVFGWEAVGRLDLGSHGFCTGALIAPDLVLTAGHCLFDRARGVPEDVGAIVFRAGLREGDAVAEARAVRAVAHPDYDPYEPTSAFSIRHDLALVQLARPIPAAVAAPFAVQAPGAGSKVSVVSYAQGREDALSWQRACTVLGRQDGLLALNCDVDFGSSGAPVFDVSDGRARIVSVISAGRKDDDGTVAFGMELPEMLGELKAALRAGRGVTGTAEQPLPEIRRIGAGSSKDGIGARFVKP